MHSWPPCLSMLETSNLRILESDQQQCHFILVCCLDAHCLGAFRLLALYYSECNHAKVLQEGLLALNGDCKHTEYPDPNHIPLVPPFTATGQPWITSTCLLLPPIPAITPVQPQGTALDCFYMPTLIPQWCHILILPQFSTREQPWITFTYLHSPQTTTISSSQAPFSTKGQPWIILCACAHLPYPGLAPMQLQGRTLGYFFMPTPTPNPCHIPLLSPFSAKGQPWTIFSPHPHPPSCDLRYSCVFDPLGPNMSL